MAIQLEEVRLSNLALSSISEDSIFAAQRMPVNSGGFVCYDTVTRVKIKNTEKKPGRRATQASVESQGVNVVQSWSSLVNPAFGHVIVVFWKVKQGTPRANDSFCTQ